MTPILRKRHLKKGGIYAVYSNSTRRKGITFFRLTYKVGNQVYGRQFISHYTYANDSIIDWGVFEYTLYAGQRIHDNYYDEDLYRSWKIDEFFEVTEDEFNKQVMMETI